MLTECSGKRISLARRRRPKAAAKAKQDVASMPGRPCGGIRPPALQTLTLSPDLAHGAHDGGGGGAVGAAGERQQETRRAGPPAAITA